MCRRASATRSASSWRGGEDDWQGQLAGPASWAAQCQASGKAQVSVFSFLFSFLFLTIVFDLKINTNTNIKMLRFLVTTSYNIPEPLTKFQHFWSL